MYEEKESVKKEKKVKEKKEKTENKFFQKKTVDLKEKKEKKATETTDKKKPSLKILSFRADYVSVLIRFGLFLIVAFIVIFVVTKIQNLGKGQTFAENIEDMKEVAEVYYKVATHRPLYVNEEVLMTLGDMEEAGLLKEVKDENGNVCSKEHSYVSLTKRSEDDYELAVYLSCNGEGQRATYPVTYEEEVSDNTGNDDTQIDDDKQDDDDTLVAEEDPVLLYEQKRTIRTYDEYSCPDGYLLSGRYCVNTHVTETIAATPKYKISPEKNTAAKYKASGYEYEYVEPLIAIIEGTYECPSGYSLEGSNCVREGTVKYRTSTEYVCSAGTPTSRRCMFTTSPTYSNRKAYCKEGTLTANNECYVTTDYSVRCITGKKDSTLNACYTTYKAHEELSDWLFDGKVTYSENYDISRLEDDQRMYEIDEYLDNGKIRYRKYIREYVSVCDDGDELKGSTCRHYDESYEERYCTNSSYHLASDKSECYTYKKASYRQTNDTYTCPDGYSKRGSGENTSCYRYEDATKVTSKTAYCTSGYDLTSDGRCVKTIAATLGDEEANYTCPDGYEKRGYKTSTQCYKKTSTDSYYYCTNTNAQLDGTRCIVPEETTFMGYSCPSGYDLVGNQCITNQAVDRILATQTASQSKRTETIWSRYKQVNGWTFTGNTKEAE